MGRLSVCADRLICARKCPRRRTCGGTPPEPNSIRPGRPNFGTHPLGYRLLANRTRLGTMIVLCPILPTHNHRKKQRGALPWWATPSLQVTVYRPNTPGPISSSSNYPTVGLNSHGSCKTPAYPATRRPTPTFDSMTSGGNAPISSLSLLASTIVVGPRARWSSGASNTFVAMNKAGGEKTRSCGALVTVSSPQPAPPRRHHRLRRSKSMTFWQSSVGWCNRCKA